jgi:hypothetical protein
VVVTARREAARLMFREALQDEEENRHERNICIEDALGHAGDSFRALLGEQAWRQLPWPVQLRFEHNPAPGESVVYHGHVVATERSIAGRVWSQLLRVVGAPLPLGAMKRATSTVVVTADADGHGQCWSRMYHQPGRFSQVIRSRKVFAGRTGLEEQLGYGLCMALTVCVEMQTLVFRSAGFYWCWRQVRLPLPAWVTPGNIEVRHREERKGLFSFVLTITHPWCGRVFRQIMHFRDAR